jgi:AcrR family transcriptional regulator
MAATAPRRPGRPALEQADVARERILETASALFYAQGYRAVGVDRLIAESGVAKMTFYKHFPSKDDLIAAYLTKANTQFWAWFDQIICSIESPRAQLEAVFDGVGKLASSPACLGCAFMHAAAEFPDPNHVGHAVALQHKRSVLQRLETMACQAKARHPRELAQDLLIIMDGAWAAARMFGPGNHAAHVRRTARALLDAHLLSRGPRKPRS